MSEQTSDINERIVKALRTIHDPEIPVNIHDLGLIYDVTVDDAGAAAIRMTLTTPNCPMAEVIPSQVQAAVAARLGLHASRSIIWQGDVHGGGLPRRRRARHISSLRRGARSSVDEPRRLLRSL